ncbi:MAG: carbon-nitrogen hydrolase family protein [Caldilineaceae bacterium]|nr:carbon-nitrogen hydrolase family protein [Caldilineaceae bacterium]
MDKRECASVTVAACQYRLEFSGDWPAYAAKVSGLVAEAAARGAHILIFPEYASLELASLCAPTVYGNVHAFLPGIQPWLPGYLEMHSELARRYHVYCVAGTFPVQLADGSYRNRAFFFRPDGSWDYQDKLIMTRFEAEEWHIHPGREAKVFDTHFGRVGINICYDSEFPLIARAQNEAGARLILTPSWTETAAGYHRVELGCRARALENQCYVAMAACVGESKWLDDCSMSVGAAGIFGPVDGDCPADGILAQGVRNEPGWVYQTVDLAAIDTVRGEGQVANYRDWSHQSGLQVRVVTEGNWFVPALVSAVTHRTHAMRE